MELPLIYRGLIGKERRKKAVEALKSLGLESESTTDLLNFQAASSSGGNCAAIVGDPKVILADEPTGALDSKTSETIMEIFQELNNERGITIVQVTHEKSIAEYSKRIYHLLDGKIERIEDLA